MKTVICFDHECEEGINEFCKLIDIPFAPFVGMGIDVVLSGSDYTLGPYPREQVMTVVKEVRWDELKAILLVVVHLDPNWVNRVEFNSFDPSVWKNTEWPEFLAKHT